MANQVQTQNVETTPVNTEQTGSNAPKPTIPTGYISSQPQTVQTAGGAVAKVSNELPDTVATGSAPIETNKPVLSPGTAVNGDGIDRTAQFDQAFKNTPDLGAARFLGAVGQKFGEGAIPGAKEYLQNRPQPNAVKGQNGQPIESTDRTLQIQNNLAQGYSNDPEVQKAIASGNKAAFDSRYSSANPDEQAIIDSFYASHQPRTSDDFYHNLLSGIPLKPLDGVSLSPQQVDAQNRYSHISSYIGAPIESISNGMSSGTITPGSIAYNDLVKANGGVESPEMMAAKQQYNQQIKTNLINQDMGIKTGNAPSVSDKTQSISDSIMNGKSTDVADLYAAAIQNDPVIKSYHDATLNDQQRVDELNKQKQKTLKDIQKQYPGMTKGQAFILADQRNTDLDNQLYDASLALNRDSSNLNYYTNLATKKFDYMADQAKQERQNEFEATQNELNRNQQFALANKPQWGVVGTSTDMFGNKVEQYGFVNPLTGEVSQYGNTSNNSTNFSSSTPQSDDAKSLAIETYMKNPNNKSAAMKVMAALGVNNPGDIYGAIADFKSSSLNSTLKSAGIDPTQMDDGTRQFLSQASNADLRTAIGMSKYDINAGGRGVKSANLQALAQAINPEYNPSIYQLVQSLHDTKSGDGAIIRAYNVALQHLGSMEKAYNQLKNTNSPLLNVPINEWGKQVSGPAQTFLTEFNTIKNALGPEAAKAFAGSKVLTDNDVKEASDLVSQNMSPNSFSGYKQGLLELMQGKLNNVMGQYFSATGKDPNQEKKYFITTPQTEKYLDKNGYVYQNGQFTAKPYTYKSPMGFTFTGRYGDNLDDKAIKTYVQGIIDKSIAQNPSLKNDKVGLGNILSKDPYLSAIQFKLN